MGVKRQQNSFWFQSNTTVHYFILSWWRHVSVRWPSPGHLYKT